MFRPLHQQLDELVESWRDLGDTVAERVVAIGFWPDGQAEAIAAGSERAGVKPGAIEGDAVVRELASVWPRRASAPVPVWIGWPRWTRHHRTS